MAMLTVGHFLQWRKPPEPPAAVGLASRPLLVAPAPPGPLLSLCVSALLVSGGGESQAEHLCGGPEARGGWSVTLLRLSWRGEPFLGGVPSRRRGPGDRGGVSYSPTSVFLGVSSLY